MADLSATLRVWMQDVVTYYLQFSNVVNQDSLDELSVPRGARRTHFTCMHS